MKTERIIAVAALALVTVLCAFAAAKLPEPDKILYGTVSVQGRAVTANDGFRQYDVSRYVIELRTSTTGAVVTSYTMGSDTNCSPYFYGIRFTIESYQARLGADSLIGDTVYLTVKENGVVVLQSTHRITERASTRHDLGPLVDSDGDGIPDVTEFETYHTDPLSRDTDGDGLRDDQEALYLTDPLDPDSDDDGYSDWREVWGGTDPNNAADHPPALAVVENDFDGDMKSDAAVYYPANGRWQIMQSSNETVRTLDWGWAAAAPVPGDYDGDGMADPTVFHQAAGSWYVRRSSTNVSQLVQWGWSAVIPVPGDYDGDGTNDIAVYWPASGTWYILQSSTGTPRQQNWGWSSAVPVPGDYDGDGRKDIAVYWPAGGTWYILQSSTGTSRQQNWGWSETVPVPGDYDGDGITDVAVYWPLRGRWYVFRSAVGAAWQQDWGWSEAVPVPGDYDGDGLTDVAVYHPSGGKWYIRPGNGSAPRTLYLGASIASPANLQYQINRYMGLTR